MDESKPQYHIESTDSSTSILYLQGNWQRYESFPDLNQLQQLTDCQHIQIDGGGIINWGSQLILFLRQLEQTCQQAKLTMTWQNFPKALQPMLHFIEADKPYDIEELSDELELVSLPTIRFQTFCHWLGELACSFREQTPSTKRTKVFYDWPSHFAHASFEALPIVGLINLLMGLILAFVASIQLAHFGAQIFVANLVGLAALREMAPVMTAVIMSGRSGAAFAAALATMKFNRELDALKVIGLDPWQALVAPRLISMVLMAPLLYLFACICSLFGGALIGTTLLQLGGHHYMHQTWTALHDGDLLLGMIKSMLFAAIITVSGCFQGMQSSEQASAIGQATTRAVVYAIIWIVCTDGLIAVLSHIWNI